MKNVTGQLVLDGDVASVVKFIETEVPTDRRVYVAERLAEIARLIWADTRCAVFNYCEQRPTASGFAPEHRCAGGDSVAAADAPPLQ